MKRELEFEAFRSGDYEAFTLAVDKETYTKITGEKPKLYSKNNFIKDTYDIYPDDFFGHGNNKIKVKLSIEIEELDIKPIPIDDEEDE